MIFQPLNIHGEDRPFFSYNSGDRESVLQVKQLLYARGIGTFVDAEI